MRKSFKLLAIGACLSAGLYFFFPSDGAVTFQSEESKTKEGAPVFNRIRYFSFPEKDVWMMAQSHFGISATPEKWDRLAIVVDKTHKPYRARFFQFEPGPLEWKENLPRKDFRVSCFLCHANGPRQIRPEAGTLPVMEKLKVEMWNLQMKNYGRVVPDPIHEEEDKKLRVPFRYSTPLENDLLTVPSCIKCHRETGLFARGALRRQNSLTIEFMLSQGHMPPLWFSLPEEEKKALRDFLNGLG
jgi:hypothetical protein